MTASYSKVLAFGSSTTWGWGGGSGGFSAANGEGNLAKLLAGNDTWEVV